jgi:hypothetical protein
VACTIRAFVSMLLIPHIRTSALSCLRRMLRTGQAMSAGEIAAVATW